MNMFDDRDRLTGDDQPKAAEPARREKLTRDDLLTPYLEGHRLAWDRLRDVCNGYGVQTPTWRELVSANAGAPGGDMMDGNGAGWFEKLGLNRDEQPLLLGTNTSIVLLPFGGILNIEGGNFIELPGEDED